MSEGYCTRINQLKSSELVASNLVGADVRAVFGLPGHTTLGLLDAIYKEPRLRFVLVKNEQAASCMADGYARASGRHGVCLSHVGPGSANMLVGVASAFRDSSPMVALLCDEDSGGLGRDVFQEWDQVGVYSKVTKWAAQARSAKEVSRLMRLAFVRSMMGRPGPVAVDLPMDVLNDEVPEGSVEKLPDYGNYSGRVRPDPAMVKTVADMLLKAERPLLVAGGGVVWSEGSRELGELAEGLAIPVAVTHTARGTLPDVHPLFAGILGRWGNTTANDLARSADLIVGIGCRFADINTLRWSLLGGDTKLVQVDIDPNEVANQYPVDVGVVADAKMFCSDVVSALKERSKKAEVSERLESMRAHLKAERDYYLSGEFPEVPIKPQRIVKELTAVLEGGTIVTVGSGKHPEFANKVTITEPRTYLKSVGFGSMGWAFPAALGAKVARPERQVAALVGDGDFIMSAQELETAVREKIAAVSVIFNDRSYTSIRRFQKEFYGGRYIGVDYANPRYDELARLFGAVGLRVEKPSELRPALQEAFRSGEPAVVDVIVDPSEFPPVRWGIMGMTRR